jgi:hypothetical protein
VAENGLMCEVLIKAIGVTNPDPTKDRIGSYKRGDIVGVEEDGYEWGKEEGLPKFYLVKIPGLSVDVARKYEQMDMESDDPNYKTVYRRRRFHIPIDAVPVAIRNALTTTGQVTVTVNQIRNYLVNKRTGLPE